MGEVRSPHGEKKGRRGREAAGDGTTGRYMKAFPLGNPEKKKPFGESIKEHGMEETLNRKSRDSLEGPHEKAEIHPKALRQWKNLAFSDNTYTKKERVRSKMPPRKVGSGIKAERRVESGKEALEIALIGIHQNEGGISFDRIERKTPVLRATL